MVALGLVVAKFDKTGEVISAMETAAREAAAESGADVVATHHVPGSYDTPLAADRLARDDDIDAVVVIGAIVRGDTDHDQIIAHAAATGLTRVSVDRDTPVTFGVIGPGMTEAEARERVGYAGTAVESAIELVEGLDG